MGWNTIEENYRQRQSHDERERERETERQRDRKKHTPRNCSLWYSGRKSMGRLRNGRFISPVGPSKTR